MQRAQRRHIIRTIKFNKKKMANTVAYPDLALEKMIEIDSSEIRQQSFVCKKEN